MRYDKINRKLLALQEETHRLQSENEKIRLESASIKEILNSTLHEVRRFSAQLSKFSERLSKETEGQAHLNQTALSVFYTAGMISSRLAYTDIELNPRALESQTPLRSGIYKKFDKARRILAEEAKAHDVTIELIGESRTEIDALPVFELLPFVLLDNGIKYSPKRQTVSVIFEQVMGHEVLIVQSIGPLVSIDELSRIFEKGFRGATASTMPGEGLGLYLAKQVCNFHSVKIRAESSTNVCYQINGVNYSEFRVVITF